MGTLGALIESRRTAIGINQTELAAACGVDPSYISRLEAGKVNLPSPAIIHALANALTDREKDIVTRPRELLEIVGYLTPTPDGDDDWPDDVTEVLDMLERLPPQSRQQAIRLFAKLVEVLGTLDGSKKRAEGNNGAVLLQEVP
ncbi:MAG: helix-turn-helix domain-containing protein [Chloroflexi bacterium]|nr:helix-turn-helix domain-containing protein [Chloroflexota bacterium]MBU1747825.1 helix-turn-helix domain-containing protein [Chloroflexota bacterium]